MKKSRYSDSQIIGILKQAESGIPVPQLCREHGMSSATFYKWRSKYGGMDVSMMQRVKELEEENRRLKKMYAEERLKAVIIQEALAKKQGIRLQYIQSGKPQQNAYIERFNRTVRHEWLDENLFESIEQAQQLATEWLWRYNAERPNMAIGGITPYQKLAMAA